ALTLATSGLPAKGWNMSIKAFDLSNKLINRAKAGNFTLEDLRWLDQAVARRWFTLRAAGWHFRTELGPPIDFIKLNLADIDSTLKDEMQGAYDVIFCRGLSFDCPDHLVQLLARTVTSLLAPWGLLFTAPGEIWLEMNDLTTEVRDGVVYGRKNGPKGKNKANVFHVPKKMVKENAAKESPDQALKKDPRKAGLLLRFKEVIQSDPDEARDLVLEMLLSEMDERTLFPETLSLMAEVEEILGREDSCTYIRSFLEKWQSPARPG
ncbi:MAG: hypothetical protein LBS44_05790, partial [Deltaproteobacteria bacterium]|nr:hypothetical protein [Deltaproteobacteria bacterium]